MQYQTTDNCLLRHTKYIYNISLYEQKDAGSTEDRWISSKTFRGIRMALSSEHTSVKTPLILALAPPTVTCDIGSTLENSFNFARPWGSCRFRVLLISIYSPTKHYTPRKTHLT